MGTCSKESCGKPTVGRGLCSAHYQQAKYHGEFASLDPAGKQCEHCGQPITGRTSPKTRFCSRKCVEAARGERRRERVQAARADRVCEECGTPIPAEVTGRAKVCSADCRTKVEHRRHVEKKHDALMARRAERGPCALCGNPIPEDFRNGAIYCSTECRRKANAAIWRERAPGYNRQRTYGVSLEQFNAMLAAQDGRCAICRSPDWPAPVQSGSPHVDHNRRCDQGHPPNRACAKCVRGLLCGHCNSGIGQFGDDPARLRAAADYLEAAMT